MGALALTLAVVLADFSPYVRSRTGDHCLWWPKQTITFSQNAVGNPATGPKAFSAVSTAFATWQVAMEQCGSATLAEGPRVFTRRIGVEEGVGPSINVVLFRLSTCAKKVPKDHWCWEEGTCTNYFDCWDHANDLLGVTTLTYNKSSGAMIDADIELNSIPNVFTAVDSPPCTMPPLSQRCVAIDIQNTMTHEVGHLMGLEHTEVASSIMNASASIGEIDKRTMDTGTKSFVCEVYTKGLAPKDCIIETAKSELGTPYVPPPKAGCASTSGQPLPLLLAALLTWIRRFRSRPSALALGMGLLSASAQATTLFALDLRTLSLHSDAVVHGTVRRIETRWSADRARIFTDIEIEVTEAWKGAPTKSILVIQPGGEIGEIGQQVAGVARFTVNEEVVVFLEEYGPLYTVTGYLQGKFQVSRKASVAVATQQDGAVALVDPASGQPSHAGPLSLRLEELRHAVLSTLGVNTSSTSPAPNQTVRTRIE